MRKFLSIILAACLMLGLVACGGSGAGEATVGQEEGGVFMAGFGMADITPTEKVPLASYGDLRFNDDGILTMLEARSVVVQDSTGNKLVFIVGDLSFCPKVLGNTIRKDLAEEFGIPEANIILSGTHTHNSVNANNTEYPAVAAYNKVYIDGMEEAARKAVADLKPAELYVGSAMTVGMNFVRRYYMDDGSLVSESTDGTGTKIVGHESEADAEVGLLRFVREGGKDILISNFQAHPHLEGKLPMVSSQTVGAIRDAVEQQLGAHSLHWNGAAGNLNSRSRIEEENRFEKGPKSRAPYGETMVKEFIAPVYDSLTKVEAGPVKVVEYNFKGTVNKSMNAYVGEAQKIVEYFGNGQLHTARETAEYARSLGVGINTVYHARRIITNAKKPDVENIPLVAWSFGDVGGVVTGYEMFDANGKYIKDNSPFERTFVIGYSYPSSEGYIPTKEAFPNGGYEVDNCSYIPGTGEEIADQFLEMLKQMHG